MDDGEEMEAALELEIKQKLSKLSDSDLKSVSAFLLRLRHGSEESKEERSRIMKEMDDGRKTSLTELQSD